MSRTAAAAAGTVTTTSNNLHLVVGHGPRGPVLTVSKTPVPGCITMACQDYHEFLFYMQQIFRVMNQGSIQTKYENTTNTPYEKIAQNVDVFKEIAFCFYAHIARLVAPGLNEHDQLERTALALYSSNVAIPHAYYQRLQIPRAPFLSTSGFEPVRLLHTAAWDTLGRRFFDMSVVQKVAASTDHQQLLDKALNAVEDLNEIKHIIENTRPEELPILLSAKGTATINHLETLNPPHSFRRTGTALQMAIYGDDEGVQALLKKYMDPAEYERQAIEAFNTVLPLDVKQGLVEKGASAATYQQKADAQQKVDAINLCAELEAAMRAADPAEFICAAPNYIASTTSAAVTAAVNTFKNELLLYTQKNSMHNRYILERLHQINASLEERSYCLGRDCFLSQQGITEAQLLMSERWVQHYARGPYNIAYIAENKDELALIAELALRTSTCRDSKPPLDIHSVMSCLRLNGRCLDIFRGRPVRGAMGRAMSCGSVGRELQILCRAKTASFQNLLRGSRELTPASLSVHA